MGRKRWAERRQSSTAAVVMGTDTAPPVGLFTADRPGVIRCGHPYGDGSTCMAPASTEHAATHRPAELATELGLVLTTWQERAVEATQAEWVAKWDEVERLETEELLNRADHMIPAKGLAEVIDGPMAWAANVVRKRPPTYEALKAAAAERAQFTTEQARTMLSAALGTRPHLAARVIDKLGPVLAGELARAVDSAVEGRISGYLSAERAELNRLYQDQSTKLEAEREQRGRDVNAERWTTPSRLA